MIIDPGHGGDNLGTEAPSGLVEKEMALDISKRLRELLERGAFEVLLTREEDEFVSLEERAVFANAVRGDLPAFNAGFFLVLAVRIKPY